jgi:hypothetical protein
MCTDSLYQPMNLRLEQDESYITACAKLSSESAGLCSLLCT